MAQVGRDSYWYLAEGFALQGRPELALTTGHQGTDMPLMPQTEFMAVSALSFGFPLYILPLLRVPSMWCPNRPAALVLGAPGQQGG